jgi:hypothetical protein
MRNNNGTGSGNPFIAICMIGMFMGINQVPQRRVSGALSKLENAASIALTFTVDDKNSIRTGGKTNIRASAA